MAELFAVDGFWFWLMMFLLAEGVLTLVNRAFRTIKVMVRGWPPEHLDADGDWKSEPKAEE